MKKIFNFFIIAAMILSVTFGVANADSDCNVKQYIQNYYSENYQENTDLEFEKVTVQDTEKKSCGY